MIATQKFSLTHASYLCLTPFRWSAYVNFWLITAIFLST